MLEFRKFLKLPSHRNLVFFVKLPMSFFKEIWLNIQSHRLHFKKGELNEFQTDHNNHTFAIGSIPLILLSFIFSFQIYYFPTSEPQNPFGRFAYSSIFGILASISICYLIIIVKLQADKNFIKLLDLVTKSYAFLLLFITSLLVALTQFDDLDITAYLLTLISVSILYSGPPGIYFLFNFTASASFVGFLYFFGLPCDIDLLMNLISISIISLTLSAIVQYSRIQTQILTSELKETNQKLNEISVRDPLTHLYNRRFLVEFLENRISSCKRTKEPLLVMLFDVDFFKKINDTHGHLVGDQVLVELAQIIKTSVRESDIVARYGGEEFVAVLPNADLEAGIKIGKRVLDLCRNTKFHKVSWTVTLSAGITEFQKNDDVSTLLNRSDQHLYKSKESGRNRIHYD